MLEFKAFYEIPSRLPDSTKKDILSDVLFLEAPPGIEPGMKVLQTSALPLGYSALFTGYEARTRILTHKSFAFAGPYLRFKIAFRR